ncbi:MAG: PHP domain-containing protein [Deltaproteobacteria bacterium]
MKLDLHIHTTAYSACSTMSPDEMMEAAKAAGLDGICVTEHDRIWTVEEAKALSDKHGLAVFRGIEITTTGGDVLVFGLDEEPQEMWTPSMLKEKVDRVGGVAIAAHPFRGFLVFGFSALEMNLDDAMDNPLFGHVHGLEICNSMVTNEENELARKVAEEMGLLKIGGSDAHKPDAVGTCVNLFEGTIEEERELVAALLGGRFTVQKTK